MILVRFLLIVEYIRLPSFILFLVWIYNTVYLIIISHGCFYSPLHVVEGILQETQARAFDERVGSPSSPVISKEEASSLGSHQRRHHHPFSASCSIRFYPFLIQKNFKFTLVTVTLLRSTFQRHI